MNGNESKEPHDYYIASHNDVERLLRIAKRHLNYISRSRSEGFKKLSMDHAIVASIFSAAAVEAGLNLFISIPILFIRDEDVRRFFGILVTKYSRLSVRHKINFSCDFCPQIKEDKGLVERVNALFDYRNSVMHSSQKYTEALGLPEDLEGLPREVSDGELIPRPQLSGRGIGTHEVDEAYQHYQTALDFLDKLKLYCPKLEDSLD